MSLLLFLLSLIVNTLCLIIPSWPDTIQSYFSLSNEYTMKSFASHLYQTEHFYIAIKNDKRYLIAHLSNGVNAQAETTIMSISNIIPANNNFYLTTNEDMIIYIVTISERNLIIKEIEKYPITPQGNERMKMFFLPNMDAIEVFFTNNDKMYNYFYKNTQNNWDQCTNTKGPLIAAGIQTEFESDTNYFFAFSKDGENSFYIVRIKFVNGSGNHTPSFSVRNIEILSHTELGFDYESNSVIVFSYNEGKENFYYYHFSIGQQKMTFYGTSHTLPFLSEMKINKAKFIDMKEIIYYEAEKVNAEGKTLYYYGVADLKYSIILYNKESEFKYDDITFFNDTYKYSSLNYDNAYLSLLKNNTQYKLCPFVYNNNNCRLYSSSEIFNISEKEGNSFVGTSNCNNTKNYKLGRYCLSKCPVGYEKNSSSSSSSSSFCQKCPNYYFYANETCNETCISPSISDEKTKICYNCKEKDLIFYHYLCVDNCEDYFAEYIESNNSCVSCKEIDKYYYNKTCNDECPKGSEILEEYNNCKRCKDYNKFLSKDKCVDQCPIDEVYDNDTYICDTCQHLTPSTPYKQEKYCVSECDIGYGQDDEKLQCIHCKSINQFYHNKQCLESCPLYYLHDDNNICYQCKDRYPSTPFNQKGQCVSKCDRGYETNSTLGICRFCKDDGLYYDHNAQCVKKCENNTFYTEEENICYYCYETEHEFFEKDKCVDKCKNGSEIIDKKVCHYCKDDGLFFNESNSKCVESCYEYDAIDRDDNICFSCLRKNGTYFFNRTCVSDCPRASSRDYINKICIYCKDIGKKAQDNACVNDCGPYFVLDESDNYCYRCSNSSSSYYYEDGKCVADCRSGSAIDEINHVCVHCKDKGQVYYEGECREQCPEMTYLMNTTSFCYLCYCSNRGDSCDRNTRKCQCNNDFITGYNCEIKNDNIENKVKIIESKELSLIIRNGINCFKVQISDKSIDLEYYNITWDFLIDGISLYENNSEYFINGIHDEEFCFDGQIIEIEKTGNIVLSLISLDNKTNYTDKIDIVVEQFEDKWNGQPPRFTLQIYESAIIQSKPFENTIELRIDDIKANDSKINKMYKFAYIDDNEVEISLSNFGYEKLFNSTFPKAKYFVAYILNDRGEIIRKNQSIIMHREECLWNDTYYGIIINNTIKHEAEKMFMLMSYFRVCKKELSVDEFNNVISFIFTYFKILVIQVKEMKVTQKVSSSKITDLSYYDANTLFVLLNSLIMSNYRYTEDSLSKIANLTNEIVIMYKELVSSRDDYEYHSLYQMKSQLKALFTSIDHLITKVSSTEIKSEFISNTILSTLSTLSSIISNYTSINEDVQLKGNYALLQVIKFSRANDSLCIPSYNGTTPIPIEYSDYQLKGCNDKYHIINILPYSTHNLKNELRLKYNTTLTSLSISLLFFKSPYFPLNDINSFTSSNLSPYTSKISLSSNGTSITGLSSFEYEISFYPNEKIEPNSVSNVTCVPLNHLKDSKHYCHSHFDFSRNNTLCKCNIDDIITYVNSSELAEFAKNIQFPSVEVNKVNILSTPIIYASLFLILIPSIILLIYDIYCDQLLLKKKTHKSEIEKKNALFKNVSHLHKSGVIVFGWYLTLYKFPYLNLYYDYNYRYPQFIKYFINIIGLLFSFILSCIPFNFITNFKEKEDFINQRNIVYDDSLVHNLPISGKYIFLGITSAFISNVIVKLLIRLVEKMISISTMHIDYWKPIKDSFKDYIYNDIKKDVLLGDKWKLIKNRIIAYNCLCAKYILGKKYEGNKKGDKLTRYLYNKLHSETVSTYTSLLPNDISISIEDSSSSSNDKLSAINKSKKDIVNPLTTKDPRKISLISIDLNDSSIIPQDNKALTICKASSFTINKYTRSVISYKSLQKFQNIRNKYISTSHYPNRKYTVSSSIDSLSNYNTNLAPYEIENIEAYSYFVHSLKQIKSNLVLKREKKEICKLSIVCIILILVVIAQYIFLLFISKTLYEKFELFIVKAWIIPSLVYLIIIDFMVCLIWNIIISLIVFKGFRLKKKNLKIKILFFLFVDKYIVYIFKIRNYISAYFKEFNYLEEDSIRAGKYNNNSIIPDEI